MRSFFDRLFRALIPYAGILTVSTCGSTPDCEESGESKTMTMTARVGGDVALDTSSNEHIETTFVREGGGAHPAWTCEARVIGRATRQRDDTTPRAVPATATVFCSIGDGRVTDRVWTFTVPLDDLRAEPLAPETTAQMEVSLQGLVEPNVSCSGKVSVRVTKALGASAGASASPPSWVTNDFARTLRATVALDDAATASTNETCVRGFRGSFTLDVALDSSSFVESDTPTCL